MENCNINETEVDITQCDEEPIHLLGKIQSFGALIVMDEDWIVRAFSANTSDFLNVTIEIGFDLKTLLNRETRHALRSALQKSIVTDQVDRVADCLLNGSDELYAVSIHKNQDLILLEFEKSADENHHSSDFLSAIILGLRQTLSLDELLELSVATIRSYTEYDRVMIYRFLPDDSGEVVAEASTALQESFLGLRFPASDIPKQARKLYMSNTLRLTADVDSIAIEIVSESDNPIDLSKVQIRAVSPVHIQYLKNMGVKSSLSVSIIIEGSLWGMLVCHHQEAKIISLQKRQQLDLFAEVLSLSIVKCLNKQKSESFVTPAKVHSILNQSISEDSLLPEIVLNNSTYLQELMQSDGISFISSGKVFIDGNTPSKNMVLNLVQYLSNNISDDIFSTTNYREIKNHIEVEEAESVGFLSIAISQNQEDYLLFFRQPISKIVRWSGNPIKSVSVLNGESRLMPRGSFNEWKKEHHDQCKDWLSNDIKTAQTIKSALLEIVIKILKNKEVRQQRDTDQKNLLIRELNHRVRNVLNLVSAIIMQTDVEGRNTNEFISIISLRIQSLANAHNQLLSSINKDIRLKTILNTELEAYDYNSNSVALTGDDVYLRSESVIPIVLVLHELLTNSAKYGALSVTGEDRKVVIVTKKQADDLLIEWEEYGGPPVKQKIIEGFGMTLIKSVIPHELSGQVSVLFKETGLRVDIRIPGKYCSLCSSQTPYQEISRRDITLFPTDHPDNSEGPVDNHVVLIVEDSLITAMDMKSRIAKKGFRAIEIAGSVQQALDILEYGMPEFAVLDINLSNEESYLIAEMLIEQGVPFCFVSGYGEVRAEREALKKIPFFTKPLTDSALENMIRLLTSGGQTHGIS